MPFRVACAQFAPRKAELARNLDRIAEIARQAASEGVDVLVFPETAVSGYFLEGGVIENALTVERLGVELQTRLEGIAAPIDLLVGFYRIANGHLTNAAAYVEWADGRAHVRHVYEKFFLPTYGVFDEERFVSRGRDLGLCDTRFGRVGVLICEDFWHSILSTLLAKAGATALYVLSATPARGFQGHLPENVLHYERMLRVAAIEHGVWCVLSSLVGFEGGKGLSGASMIVSPEGEVVVRGPLAEEALVVADLDPDLVTLARYRTPLISDLHSNWADLKRLIAEID